PARRRRYSGGKFRGSCSRANRASLEEVDVDPEQEQRADDRHDPAGGMKLAVGSLPDQTADEPADDRATDPERHREPEAERHGTRIEEPRQDADNEADDDRAD